MPDQPTLTDDDIETRPLGAGAPTSAVDTGDDTGDPSDTADTGDDAGDKGDTGDSGDTGDEA